MRIAAHYHTIIMLYILCMCYSTVVAERRKQAIVESKFLGGDIQHTHLVKGLDFVLLDKVYKFTFLCK